MSEDYRIVIEFHGEHQYDDAQDKIDEVRQVCMRRDPGDEPMIYLEKYNEYGGLWEKSNE